MLLSLHFCLFCLYVGDSLSRTPSPSLVRSLPCSVPRCYQSSEEQKFVRPLFMIIVVGVGVGGDVTNFFFKYFCPSLSFESFPGRLSATHLFQFHIFAHTTFHWIVIAGLSISFSLLEFSFIHSTFPMQSDTFAVTMDTKYKIYNMLIQTFI